MATPNKLVSISAWGKHAGIYMALDAEGQVWYGEVEAPFPLARPKPGHSIKWRRVPSEFIEEAR